MTEIRRADMHVHSTASELSKLGIQRSLHLPECATPPDEVYRLAKRRGMDFVTITDHDTIAGALELDHLPDAFISEELTAWFKGESQAVHVLCYGITPDDHEWLQAHNDDLEACAEYLHAGGITAALAHPFYAVEAPLTARHRRRLAQLFPIWETRNGSRAKELNLPAFVYIETHGGTRDWRLGRPRWNRHRAHVHGDTSGGVARRVSGSHQRRPRRCPRSPGQRPEVDPRGDVACDPLARTRQ